MAPLPVVVGAVQDPESAQLPFVGQTPAHRNIVFFGETGVGKSAIINMLREEAEQEFEFASVSNGALGCTLMSTRYPLRLGKDVYNLWDTAGLVEGTFGSVTAAEAEDNLVRLLQTIPGGVNLLVYCVRGRRYRNIIKENYDLFFKKTCGRKVPIVLVITGLENENRMEDWWTDNEAEFKKRHIKFADHACITSARGKEDTDGGRMFDMEYEESLKTLRSVVTGQCLAVGVECKSPDVAQDAVVRQQVVQGPEHFTKQRQLVHKSIQLVHRNIIFFGETGVGKSAIINMLREEAEEEFGFASVSNGAIGCTLMSTRYPLRLGKDVYNLWDTAGLVEGTFGSVTAAEAEDNLVRLLQTIPGGVNLLVYCVRGRRYRNIIKENYELFFEKTCQREVPIVLVITGLENENRMEDWWTHNEGDFEKRDIQFDDHACITSTRGKEIEDGGRMFDAEYELSLKTLRAVVTRRCLAVGVECTAAPDFGQYIARDNAGAAGPTKRYS